MRNLGISAGEQLGLIAQPGVGVPANGTDFFSGGYSPGFASSYTPGTGVPSAFHFTLFSFDQQVSIPGVTVDDVTNQERDIWMATGATMPDFTGGFLTGLSGLDSVNSSDDPQSDGLFTHNLGAIGIRYLLVGAPPEAGLGPLAAGNSHFFIDSFDATPVPVPAAVWLFGSALGLLGWIKRKTK